MDKVQKHNSFNTNTPSSESYRNYKYSLFCLVMVKLLRWHDKCLHRALYTEFEL